jgi:predicted nucleic acid-binding protein
MFLIDTDVLSALSRRPRDANVEAWFRRQRASHLFLSVLTIGEIERGIAMRRRLDPGFAATLASWLDQVLSAYSQRILPFNLAAARRWGVLSAALGNTGADLQIAATALEHGLTVVTRNTADFKPTGVDVVNPFTTNPRREG